jgi:hypothetical protein
MAHILERFIIHFFSSCAITLMVFFVLRYWGQHNRKVPMFISGRHGHLVVTAALIVFAFATLREPFDIALGGQVWYKAIFDQASWLLGCATAAWGLYRFKKMEA